MFKKPLSIYCYKYADGQHQLAELGVPTTEPLDNDEITFYSIDNIDRGTPQWMTEEVGFIKSGGQEYATILTYEHLKDVIDKHLQED